MNEMWANCIIAGTKYWDGVVRVHKEAGVKNMLKNKIAADNSIIHVLETRVSEGKLPQSVFDEITTG